MARLERDVDTWVASAGATSGGAHLVPLSFLWDGTTVLLSTPAGSPTCRNLVATGKVQPLSKVDVKSKASGIVSSR